MEFCFQRKCRLLPNNNNHQEKKKRIIASVIIDKSKCWNWFDKELNVQIQTNSIKIWEKIRLRLLRKMSSRVCAFSNIIKLSPRTDRPEKVSEAMHQKYCLNWNSIFKENVIFCQIARSIKKRIVASVDKSKCWNWFYCLNWNSIFKENVVFCQITTTIKKRRKGL